MTWSQHRFKSKSSKQADGDKDRRRQCGTSRDGQMKCNNTIASNSKKLTTCELKQMKNGTTLQHTGQRSRCEESARIVVQKSQPSKCAHTRDQDNNEVIDILRYMESYPSYLKIPSLASSESDMVPCIVLNTSQAYQEQEKDWHGKKRALTGFVMVLV